ncbi:MAG: hypothetical protein ACRDNP_10390 [Gaiellaceae bacterium]
MYVVTENGRLARLFSRDLAREKDAFDAAGRFAERNNALRRRVNPFLKVLYDAIPEKEQIAIDRALMEAYGR